MHRWLQQLRTKREQLVVETDAYFAAERTRSVDDEERQARRLCVMIARKLHHLLRTHNVPGVYSRKQTRNCGLEQSKGRQQLCEVRNLARTKVSGGVVAQSDLGIHNQDVSIT